MNAARTGRAAAAFGCAAAAAGLSLATRSGGPGGYLVLLAVVSLLLFGVGVGVRWTALVALGVGGLGVTHVAGHLRTDDAPELIAVVALLTTAFELGGWSTELATAVTDAPGAHRARWVWVLGWGLGGGMLAALVLGTTTVRIGGRIPLDLLAVMAALLVLAAIAASALAFPGHGAGDGRPEVPESSAP